MAFSSSIPSANHLPFHIGERSKATTMNVNKILAKTQAATVLLIKYFWKNLFFLQKIFKNKIKNHIQQNIFDQFVKNLKK